MLLSLNNFKYFNFIFMLFLLMFNFSYSKFKTSKIKQSESCKIVHDDREVEEKVNITLETSKEKTNKDVYYFIFFASKFSIINIDRKDNFTHMKEFASKVNSFFSDFMNFSYFCRDETNKDKNAITHYHSAETNKFDKEKIYVIQNGEIKETKTVKYFSEDFMDFLIHKMNLSKLVETKLIQSI